MENVRIKSQEWLDNICKNHKTIDDEHIIEIFSDDEINTQELANTQELVNEQELANTQEIANEQELTTQELTTQELTTQELTTQELTTQELTTQEELPKWRVTRDLQCSVLRNFINDNKLKKITNSSFSLDKIAGLILGCALADSIGIQNINKNNIVNGPSDDTSRSYAAGDWSSNTDQLIINLELLTSEKMNYNYELFINKLLYWKNHGFKELGDHEGIGIKRLTAYVLSQSNYENEPVKCATVSYINMDNTFAPNDSLIRSAILAINSNWGKCIIKQCALTHIDNRCIYTSWIFCLIINCIDKNIYPDLEEIFKDYKVFLQLELHLLEFEKYNNYFKLWVERKNELMEFKMLDMLNISDTYETSYIFKSLGVIIYVYLIIKANYEIRADRLEGSDKLELDELINFYKSIVLNIVNKGGDSEVNGGIAGALLGVYIGYLNLPDDWMQTLINRKWLENKVKLLFGV